MRSGRPLCDQTQRLTNQMSLDLHCFEVGTAGNEDDALVNSSEPPTKATDSVGTLNRHPHGRPPDDNPKR